MKEISTKIGAEKVNRGSSHALPQTGRCIYFNTPVRGRFSSCSATSPANGKCYSSAYEKSSLPGQTWIVMNHLITPIRSSNLPNLVFNNRNICYFAHLNPMKKLKWLPFSKPVKQHTLVREKETVTKEKLVILIWLIAHQPLFSAVSPELTN